MTYYITSNSDSNNLCDYRNLIFQNEVKTIICLIKSIPIFISCYDDLDIYHLPIIEDLSNNIYIDNFIDIINKIIQNGINKIIIQCFSGNYRSPFLVCIAIIYLDKKDILDTIEYVRYIMPNWLNHKQLRYLEKLKKSKRRCVIL